jgi:aspartate-semialdehyde dehydrogenase
LPDTIALIGGETLLGKEVREVLAASELADRLRLVASAEEDTGTLTEVDGGAAFLAKLDPEDIEDARVLILAGTAEASETAIAANPSGLVVDLTLATEDDPDARIRAPQVESPDGDRDTTGPQIVAHTAAIVVAMVLRQVDRNFPIARAIVHIFEPASERGTAGIEELQHQTLNLLSFQPLPKKVFDAQLAYALLAQLGPEAPTRLADVEDRIERHLASLLERVDGPPMPSLRLIQAPVFHGYTFSFWIEFEEAPAAPDLEDALSQEPFDLRGADLEAPNNVGVAGQSGISVGAISPDRNNSSAFWIWAAADNLRLAAETAALIAAEAL